MATSKSAQAAAHSLAGGAIAVALVDLLIERKIITTKDALSLLATSQKRCAHAGAPDAAEIVGKIYTRVISNA